MCARADRIEVDWIDRGNSRLSDPRTTLMRAAARIRCITDSEHRVHGVTLHAAEPDAIGPFPGLPPGTSTRSGAGLPNERETERPQSIRVGLGAGAVSLQRRPVRWKQIERLLQHSALGHLPHSNADSERRSSPISCPQRADQSAN